MNIIQQLQNPIEALFLTFIVLFVIRYFVLKYLPFDELEFSKKTFKKIFNIILILILAGFIWYFIKFTTTNVVKKTIPNNEYLDNAQNRLKENSK